MGISCFQLNIYSITDKISKINKQLMSISDQRIEITTELYDIIGNSDSWNTDPNVKLLQSKDNQLDIEQKNIETQLQALEANLENMEKQKKANIKSGVANLS